MIRRLAAWLVILLLLAQGTLPSIAVAGDSGRSEKQVRVLATTLNVRSGPGTTNTVIASLAKGAAATLVEEQGDWMMIRLEDGSTGWAAAKFLEVVTPDGPASEELAPANAEKETPRPIEQRVEPDPGETDGGSAFRGILKWSSLVGAAAFGGLALSEHSKGNSSYDEYKKLYRMNEKEQASAKYKEAEDHDGKAQTFAIVGGSLFGLFLLQQFVFDGKGNDEAEWSSRRAEPALAWSPATGEMRAGLKVRF